MLFLYKGDTMMVKNEISQDIDNLIELQQVYKDVFRLEKRKKQLTLDPEEIEKILSGIEEEIDTLKEDIEAIDAEVKSNNVDIDTLKDDISKIREKQKIVQSPKEFAYLDKQEKQKKEEISEIQAANKNILKEKEELNKELEEKKQEYEFKENEIKEQQENAQEEISEIDKKLETMSGLQKKLASIISLPVLRDFERIAKGMDGIGIVPIENNFCSGCNISLPPRIVSRVRRKNEIIHCMNCARILYWQ